MGFCFGFVQKKEKNLVGSGEKELEISNKNLFMKTKKRFIYATIIFLLAIFIAYILYMHFTSDNKLIQQGNEIVKQIELFKLEKGRLPNNLVEIGIVETEANPFYEKRSDLDYIVFFNIGFDDILVYSSNSKRWGNSQEEVKQNNQLLGGDKDIHGCIGSAGYLWCEQKQKCLRIWEEKCESK